MLVYQKQIFYFYSSVLILFYTPWDVHVTVGIFFLYAYHNPLKRHCNHPVSKHVFKGRHHSEFKSMQYKGWVSLGDVELFE